MVPPEALAVAVLVGVGGMAEVMVGGREVARVAMKVEAVA